MRGDERIEQSQVTVLITKGTAGLLADPPRPRNSSVSSPELGRLMLSAASLVTGHFVFTFRSYSSRRRVAWPGYVRRRIRTAAPCEARGRRHERGECRDRDAVQGLDYGA